jgi:adenylate kinase
MRILLFGPPGVGKGTQADLLSKKYNCIKFSTGDFLRGQISLSSPLGTEVKDYIERGSLVPDNIIIRLVQKFLDENRDRNVIFDGFPRTMNQALMLERALGEINMSVDLAIELHLNEEEIMKRLLSRQHCPHCGKIYNNVTDTQENGGICNTCGHALVKRTDDDEAVIKKRIKVYRAETKPLADYYKSKGTYRCIDASGSREEVFKKISEIINERADKK